MTDKQRQDANKKLADDTLKLAIERLNQEKRHKKEPCSPGCTGHVSHPCEKCGQQWGKRPEPILPIFKWGRKKETKLCNQCLHKGYGPIKPKTKITKCDEYFKDKTK